MRHVSAGRIKIIDCMTVDPLYHTLPWHWKEDNENNRNITAKTIIGINISVITNTLKTA